MWREAMRMLWMFHLFVFIAGQDSCVMEDVQVWKFRDGEPANLTVLGDTDNGCKFVLQTDEDRTCCYMNDTRQKYPEYNICGDQQSEDCISKSRFGVSQPNGQGKCILTLNNFQKSDAGMYYVEFPNERRTSKQIKKIEILERKYEIKEIVVGQTAITVFKGDIKEKGCRFEAHLSSGTCCYEGKRRQSCKPDNKCTEYRDSSSYEVKEDGNKCVLYLNNFQTSDVGEYEVIFPGDKHDNEKFKMKKAIKLYWSALIVFFVAIAILIVFWLTYLKRKRLQDEKLTKGSHIFEALHNMNLQCFKERLGRRNILKVIDRNKNNLFHKVADRNWTAEMTAFLEHQCETIFEQDSEDPENRELNNVYNKRQKIFCARLPHETWWIAKKSQINSWIINIFGDGDMLKFYKAMFPLTHIDLNSRNESGKTPLHIAAEKNDLDIVKVLLDNADVEPNLKDNNHCTPLQRAVLNQQCDGIRKPDNIEIVQLLLERAGPMSKTVNGQNILHSAVMKNNLDVLKLIISSTVSNQQEQLLKERYSKEVTDRITKNKKVQWTEKTPLELAIKFRNKEIVEYLVREDKLWNTVDQAWGMPAIYLAVSYCQKRILNILMRNGGKFDPFWIVDDNLEGLNCIRKVIRDKNPGAVNILLESHLIKLDKSQIEEAINFAEKEEKELIENENKETGTGKKQLKSGNNTEILTCIIKALKRINESKSVLESDEDIMVKIRELQATKKDILKNIKTIEIEREEEREKYKKYELNVLINEKNNVVKEEIRLRSLLNKPREPQESRGFLSIETIRNRLRNIEDEESTINQKKIKQIMQLLEQTG